MKEIITRLEAQGHTVKPTTIKGIARKLKAPLTNFYGREAIIEYCIFNKYGLQAAN
jgi:hypothetical protein